MDNMCAYPVGKQAHAYRILGRQSRKKSFNLQNVVALKVRHLHIGRYGHGVWWCGWERSGIVV